MSEQTQRCPACTLFLPETSYSKSCWGTRGEACRTCKQKRQREWIKNNPEKIAARWRRWIEKQPKQYERNRKLKQYGMNRNDLDEMLLRQNYSCAGCLMKIDSSASIDHNHKNGQVRGILCDLCNMVLGAVKENPGTLRQLMAYLDSDRKKVRLYLIGALKNTRVPEIGNSLRKLGYDVMDEWYTPGEFADTNWQAYEKQRGRTYAEAIRGRAATNIFLFDKSYLDLADVAIMVMPAGKSAMIELGYAKGRKKKTIIFLDGVDPDRYDIMPGFADHILQSETELLAVLPSPDTFKEFRCSASQ